MSKSRKQLMKERRQNSFQFLLSIIVLGLGFSFYEKANNGVTTRIMEEKKELSIMDDQLLVRQKGFYNNTTYLEKYTRIAKEWSNKNVGGIEFNEHNGEKK